MVISRSGCEFRVHDLVLQEASDANWLEAPQQGTPARVCGFKKSSAGGGREYSSRCSGVLTPAWLRAARPELKDRDFFVTGESYAGHYIPVVTHHIWRTNKAKPESERINLAGMAIGNGMCVPSLTLISCSDVAVCAHVPTTEATCMHTHLGLLVNQTAAQACKRVPIFWGRALITNCTQDGAGAAVRRVQRVRKAARPHLRFGGRGHQPGMLQDSQLLCSRSLVMCSSGLPRMLVSSACRIVNAKLSWTPS